MPAGQPKAGTRRFPCAKRTYVAGLGSSHHACVHAPCSPPGTTGTPGIHVRTCHFLLLWLVALRDRRLLAGHFAREEPAAIQEVKRVPARVFINQVICFETSQERVTEMQFINRHANERSVLDRAVICSPHSSHPARCRAVLGIEQHVAQSLLNLNVITLSQYRLGQFETDRQVVDPAGGGATRVRAEQPERLV